MSEFTTLYEDRKSKEKVEAKRHMDHTYSYRKAGTEEVLGRMPIHLFREQFRYLKGIKPKTKPKV